MNAREQVKRPRGRARVHLVSTLLGAALLGGVIGSSIGAAQAAEAVTGGYKWVGSQSPYYCTRNISNVDFNGNTATIEARTYTSGCTGGSPSSQPVSFLGAASYVRLNGSSTICASASMSYNSVVSGSWGRYVGPCRDVGLVWGYGYTAWYQLGVGYHYSYTYHAGPVYQ